MINRHIVLHLIVVLTLSSCASDYKSHNYLLIRTNCAYDIVEEEKNRTEKILRSTLSEAFEKDYLYRYLNGCKSENRFVSLYNRLIDEAFEEEKFDFVIKADDAKDHIYKIYPEMAKNDYLAQPLLDFYVDTSTSVRIKPSKSLINIINTIKKEKLEPSEIFALYNAISSLQDSYKELIMEITKLPVLVESVQEGLRAYFENSTQLVYSVWNSALKTAHIDRAGNAYISKREMDLLNPNQIVYFLAHESYHVASKYTYNLISNHFFYIMEKINKKDLDYLLKNIPKNLIVNIPAIYLCKHTDYDIDAKVLYKFSNVPNFYEDYVELIGKFSDTNSDEYINRQNALSNAKKFRDSGGTYNSFFQFQLIALAIDLAVGNEEEIQKQYKMTAKDYREFALNLFFTRNNLKRTPELEECLYKFYQIKMISLIKFISTIKV